MEPRMHTNYRRQVIKKSKSYFSWTGQKEFRKEEQRKYRFYVRDKISKGDFDILGVKKQWSLDNFLWFY
jgi:hypothetical protein